VNDWNFTRIGTDDLARDYGEYIPDAPARINPALYEEFLSRITRTEQNEPTTRRKGAYKSFAEDLQNLKDLVGEGYGDPSNSFDFISKKYAGLIDDTREGRDLLSRYNEFSKQPLISVASRLAGVGGGEYISDPADLRYYPKTNKDLLRLLNNTPPMVGYQIEDISDNSGNTKQVIISRDPASLGALDPYGHNTAVSSNVLQMLEDKKDPLKGIYQIMFEVDGELEKSKNVSADMQSKIMDYVKKNAFLGLPPNSIVVNQPTSEGRGAWYQRLGFGAPVAGNQYAYLDDEGRVVPIQPQRDNRLSGKFLTRAYGSFDPLAMAVSAMPDVLRNIKKAPASLLPGAADLIPSPEAIRTGYAQGPVEMGKQMAQEFVQSLPTAAGAATLLSMPAAAPFAPGIGAGMVGTAGAKALNEVVRQETGEGIVPKVRQFLGTAPRTGVSAPQVQGEKPLTAEIRPLTQAQRQKMNQQATQGEMQRRMELAKQRFNPRKGEFGLSELIFGR